MKYRFVLAFTALVLIGSFAVAQAQVSSGSPYILEVGHAKVSAGNDRTQVTYGTSTGAGDWHQVFFTPKGRTPVKWSFRDTGLGTGVLHLSAPAPPGGIVFDYQVVVWEP